MKYREQVSNLLNNIEVRRNYLQKAIEGSTPATQQDILKIINEIKYNVEKAQELVDLESSERQRF